MKVNLRNRMERDLKKLDVAVRDAQKKSNSAREILLRLQTEQRALQTALNIFDGKERKESASEGINRDLIIKVLKETTDLSSNDIEKMSENGGAVPPTFQPKEDVKCNLPEGWTKGILNGEEILLEPGYVVAKNSFGEEAIVKSGAQFTPMSEPVKPDGHAELLPPVTSQDGFDSVEEMLDG